MSPQMFQSMTTEQREKVVSVAQAQADLKSQEVDALQVFVEIGSVAAGRVFGSDEDSQRLLQNAVKSYFVAKHAQSMIELEQIQLTLTALKSWQSPIVGAHFTRR